MLTVTGLLKSFATGAGPLRAIDNIDFIVPEGHCYALLGPSGCGKTTTLRCVAGLEHPDSGTIAIGGRTMFDAAGGIAVPTYERSIGMVFQSYAIWPHLDVFENVAYPLRVKRPRLPRGEIETRVIDVLALVGMQAMARRPSTQLSGGQQQRIALARAIVHRPTLLLLDEPLSNLDARLREQMRGELSSLIARIGITALYVTHDQSEAFALADRVAVMDHGRIVQEGAPRDIYTRPRGAFVATFLGAANVLAGTVERRHEGGEAVVVLAGGDHRLALATDLAPGQEVSVMIRPEDISVSSLPLDGTDNVLPGQVVQLSFQGAVIECEIELAGGIRLRTVAHCSATLAEGAEVWLRVSRERSTVFPREDPHSI